MNAQDGLRRFRTVPKGEQGSFTVEASLVFPAVLTVTLCFIFVSLYVYQNAVLYHIASVMAERSAFTWDNSKKDALTGAFHPTERDSLYWRLTDDRSAEVQLIGDSSTGNPSGEQHIPAGHSPGEQHNPADNSPGEQNNPSALPEKKLLKAAQFLADGTRGELGFTNRLLVREITVRLRHPFHFPSAISEWFGADTVFTQAKAAVVEPVELIRAVDLARTYGDALLQNRDKAKAIFGQFADKTASPDEAGLSFRSDAEANVYLRRLVGGAFAEMQLKEPGKTRQIDALDKSRVAHQAKVGYISKNKDIEDQIAKDVELMRTGAVNGVVWHFFRKSKDGLIGPSKPLKQLLESNGIVVVIHE